jgi:hypothetical protein
MYAVGHNEFHVNSTFGYLSKKNSLHERVLFFRLDGWMNE